MRQAQLLQTGFQDGAHASKSGLRLACAIATPRVSRRSRTRRPSLTSQRARTVVNFKNAETTMPAPATLTLTEPSGTKPKPKTLSWAGAGIFFFWQLGAVKYLAERYDLTRVPMAGASGGALAAVLAACGVPADLALQRAYELSLKHGIWERPIAKVGSWGSLIEQWLDDLLPDDAAERCRGKVTVVVTTLPNMAQLGISDFADKRDLINAAMASAHIPMLLDLKFARLCRGRYCVDGSFPDFFYNDNSELLKAGGSAVIFDYFNDTKLVRKGRMDMLSLKQYEEVRHIMKQGYQYAQSLWEQGHFEHFEVGEVMFDHLEDAARGGAAAPAATAAGATAGAAIAATEGAAEVGAVGNGLSRGSPREQQSARDAEGPAPASASALASTPPVAASPSSAAVTRPPPPPPLMADVEEVPPGADSPSSSASASAVTDVKSEEEVLPVAASPSNPHGPSPLGMATPAASTASGVPAATAAAAAGAAAVAHGPPAAATAAAAAAADAAAAATAAAAAAADAAAAATAAASPASAPTALVPTAPATMALVPTAAAGHKRQEERVQQRQS